MFIPFGIGSTADRETVVSFASRERLYLSPGSRKIFPPLSRAPRDDFHFRHRTPRIHPRARAGVASAPGKRNSRINPRVVDWMTFPPPDRRNPRNHRPSLRHARSRVTAPAIASTSLRPDARMQLRHSNLSALLESVAGWPRRRPRSSPSRPLSSSSLPRLGRLRAGGRGENADK